MAAASDEVILVNDILVILRQGVKLFGLIRPCSFVPSIYWFSGPAFQFQF